MQLRHRFSGGQRCGVGAGVGVGGVDVFSVPGVSKIVADSGLFTFFFAKKIINIGKIA